MARKVKWREIWVNVTKNDIEAGAKESCHACPIALAIKRRLKPGVEFLVSATMVDIRLTTTSAFQFIGLCDKAIEFIDAFDRGREVKPIRFLLGLPVNSLKG